MLDSKIKGILKKTVNKYSLLEKGDKVLIGFSGGPDSVFLFYCLNFLKEEYDLELEIVYINHQLRDDVNEDINFIKDFSNKNDVKFHIKDINIREISKEKKISEEEAGREGRYEIFGKLLEERNFDKIATGHNLDDNVETFIFRLLRGTSLKGLKGIPVKRGNIIRPLLFLEKEKIVESLDKSKNTYRLDSTNQEVKYTRNKIRNLIFPLFDEINPLFREKIQKLIGEIDEMIEFDEVSEVNKTGEFDFKQIKKNLEEGFLNLDYLKELDEIQKNKKIFSLISRYNIEVNRKKIEQIKDLIYSKGNKEINLGNGFKIYKNYDKLRVLKQKEKNENLVPRKMLIEYGQELEWGKYIVVFKAADEFVEDTENQKDEKNSLDFCSFSLDKSQQVFIRGRKEGDKVYVKNLGYKKIKKIFIDEKIEKWDRDFIPIIEINNEIIAVGDLKISGKILSEKDEGGHLNAKLVIRRKNAK